MKKLIILLAIAWSFNCFGQSTPPIDTANYLQKSASAIRTDTTATNLLTLNQTNHTVDMMSGGTLKSYFQNGVLKYNSAYNILSKSANYTVVSGDILSTKLPVLIYSIDCTSGNNTQTLPSASSYTNLIIIATKTDVTTNTVTFSGVSTDNIIGVKGTIKEFISINGNWVNK